MKRLNQAYKAGDAEGIGNLVRQWETSPYATAAADRPAAPRPRCVAAVAHAEPRLAEARDSDLARLMEQAFQASMAGRDLLVELRQDAEAGAAARLERGSRAAGHVDDQAPPRPGRSPGTVRTTRRQGTIGGPGRGCPGCCWPSSSRSPA